MVLHVLVVDVACLPDGCGLLAVMGPLRLLWGALGYVEGPCGGDVLVPHQCGDERFHVRLGVGVAGDRTQGDLADYVEEIQEEVGYHVCVCTLPLASSLSAFSPFSSSLWALDRAHVVLLSLASLAFALTRALDDTRLRAADETNATFAHADEGVDDPFRLKPKHDRYTDAHHT